MSSTATVSSSVASSASATTVPKKVAAPKKEKVVATSTPVVAAPVAAVVAAPVAAVVAAPVAAVPVAPVAAAAPAVDEPTTDESLAAMSVSIVSKLQQATLLLSSLKTEYKMLERGWAKKMKSAQKNAKRKRSTTDRTPSGFVKPTRISDSLAVFLGKALGTEMARTDVTKEITAYVRTHSLQNPTNGRLIVADDKLKTLLNIDAAVELSYFNLQKYLKHHFTKMPVAVAASATA